MLSTSNRCAPLSRLPKSPSGAWVPSVSDGDHRRHLRRLLQVGAEAIMSGRNQASTRPDEQRDETEDEVDREARGGERVDLLGRVLPAVVGREADDGRRDPEVEQAQQRRHRADEDPDAVAFLARSRR